MSDTIHAGDLAEYQGKVKEFAGDRCEVLTLTAKRVLVAFPCGGAYGTRYIKPENLKRLGGGVIDEG